MSTSSTTATATTITTIPVPTASTIMATAQRRRWIPRFSQGGHGALAPPVGLEPDSLLDSVFDSVLAASFSPAEVPPPVPALLSLGADSFDSLFSASPELGVSPVVPVPAVLVFDGVVVVDVVWMAAFSALVLVGGVMSGVLLGTASETLLPPQAARAALLSSAASTLRAMRACAERVRRGGAGSGDRSVLLSRNTRPLPRSG